jgi:LysM domain
VTLGSRSSRWRRAVRCLVVWAAGSLALGALTLQMAARASELWASPTSLDALPLQDALLDLSALALVACGVWAWAVLTVTVGEALVLRADAGPLPAARRTGARRTPLVPGGARRLVLAACGVALVSGLAQPALAAGSPHALHHRHPWGLSGLSGLSGLPLPERAVAPDRGHRAASLRPSTAPSVPAPTRTVVVRPGDSLWSIAARDLPAGTRPAEAVPWIARRWRAIYAANRAVIGADPDVLLPGQRLEVPAPSSPSTTRKER